MLLLYLICIFGLGLQGFKDLKGPFMKKGFSTLRFKFQRGFFFSFHCFFFWKGYFIFFGKFFKMVMWDFDDWGGFFWLAGILFSLPLWHLGRLSITLILTAGVGFAWIFSICHPRFGEEVAAFFLCLYSHLSLVLVVSLSGWSSERTSVLFHWFWACLDYTQEKKKWCWICIISLMKIWMYPLCGAHLDKRHPWG